MKEFPIFSSQPAETEEYQTGCLLCGRDLVYSDQEREVSCSVCGAVLSSNATCVQGHFVCDRCHRGSANDLIESYCNQSNLVNPLQLARQIMKLKAVKMHGPEHHFLVPAVLLTAYYNRLNAPHEKVAKLKIARSRAENVLGGFCGFYGACGAAIGNGIFFSVITEATPLSTDRWRLSNLATAESLQSIAQKGGPRCCKRDSFLAIQSAVRFLKKHKGVALETDERTLCSFSALNKECIKRRCPFFPDRKKV